MDPESNMPPPPRSDSDASWGSDWDVKRDLSQHSSSQALAASDSSGAFSTATLPSSFADGSNTSDGFPTSYHPKQALGYPTYPHSNIGLDRVNASSGTAAHFGHYPLNAKVAAMGMGDPWHSEKAFLFRRAITIIGMLALALFITRRSWQGYFSPGALSASDAFSQTLPPGLVVDRVIFFKTHKTGSTTVGNLLDRWAAFHGKKVRCEGTNSGDPCSNKEGGRHAKMRPNFLVDHGHKEKALHRSDVFSITNLLTKVYSESGLAPPLSERSWKSVEAGLAKAVGLSSLGSRTRLDDQVGVVTILRHPISHYLSYYAYYVEPDDPDKGLKRYMQSPDRISNPLASEFGVYDENDLLDFLNHTDDLRHFSVILLLDRLEESLMVMKILFNWDVKDVIYGHARNSAILTERVKDRKPVSPPPQYQDLDSATRQAIMEALTLDLVLYERADALLDRHISYLRTRVDWDKELAELRKWVDALKHTCSPSASSQHCSTLCAFFGLDTARSMRNDGDGDDSSRSDSKSRLSESGGFVDVPENVNWDAIQRSMEKMNKFC